MKRIIFTLTSLAFLGLSTANAQVGIGTNTPNTSAVLELQSTDKGFLPPRLTTAQRDAISSPASGLTIFNTNQNCLNVWVGYWRNLFAFDNTASIGTINNNYEAVYNPATGLTWLDRNLGASRVATSSTDADAYGDLYQWGRAADGHQIRTSGTIDGNTASNRPNDATDQGAWDELFIRRDGGDNNWLENTSSNNNLWDGVDGTNNPCPTGFRLPTEAEWVAERISWRKNDADGAFASPLKLPVAGDRARQTGNITGGVGGNYWSSTVSGDEARSLNFSSNSNSGGTNNYRRANGLSVRCIKD